MKMKNGQQLNPTERDEASIFYSYTNEGLTIKVSSPMCTPVHNRAVHKRKQKECDKLFMSSPQLPSTSVLQR